MNQKPGLTDSEIVFMHVQFTANLKRIKFLIIKLCFQGHEQDVKSQQHSTDTENTEINSNYESCSEISSVSEFSYCVVKYLYRFFLQNRYILPYTSIKDNYKCYRFRLR